ncbi:MAG: hypothetical protein KDA47_11705, partial [Planctomycetales bacterium]|nr:hypothetical protein [Planctomycetales bacterium]
RRTAAAWRSTGSEWMPPNDPAAKDDLLAEGRLNLPAVLPAAPACWSQHAANPLRSAQESDARQIARAVASRR